MNEYTNMLNIGERVLMNKDKSAKYYKMEADNDNLKNIKNYANMLFKGNALKYINEVNNGRGIKTTFDIKLTNLFYRYIRIMQTGISWDINNSIYLQNLEFFRKIEYTNSM